MDQTGPIAKGDRVILRADGEVWTVDQVRDDMHVLPLVLISRMFGDGPIQIANVRHSDVVKVSR